MEKLNILSPIVLTNEHNNIDPQPRKRPPEPGIPVVGDLLHVISLTAIVFLRSRFGYSYLQYGSNFIIIAFVVTLFSAVAVISQNDNTLWYHTRVFSVFILFSIALFFLHWVVAYFSIYLRKAEHEQSAGISWFGNSDIIRVFIEPVLVLSIGTALYLHSSETLILGIWLFLTSIAMSIKEAYIAFHLGRKERLSKDSIVDAEKIAEKTESKSEAPLRKGEGLFKGFFKRKKSPKPTKSDDGIFQLKRNYARVLGLQPPYTYEQAKVAYDRKIKEDQPDLKKLNEAKNFFKKHSS